MKGLGGHRLANSGKGQHDGVCGFFAVEHKCVSTDMPKWLSDALAQSRRNAPGGMVPIVGYTFCPGAGQKRRRIVVCEYDIWQELHGSKESDES